jgi:transposase
MKPNVSTVGLDLAKQIFHLVGTDTTGKIVWRKRLTRHALAPFMAPLPPVTIGMEACGGAHDWARQFHQQGRRVKRMAPQFVKPSVKSNLRFRYKLSHALRAYTLRECPGVCRCLVVCL